MCKEGQLQTPNFVQDIMDQVYLKKKNCRGKKKVAQDDFQGGCSLPFNFRHIFDQLNIIIWTSSPSKLFKIKFSSQVAMNYAILMDNSKATD